MNRHGLLGRWGWLWIVVPSLLAFGILGGFAQHAEGVGARETPASNVLFAIAGFILIGLPIELIVREVVVFRRRRRPAALAPVPPDAVPVPVPMLVPMPPPAQRQPHRHSHWAGFVWVGLLFLVLAGITGSFVVDGIQKQVVRHSSSTVSTLATVERNSSSCGRGCTYTSYVTVTIGDRTYRNVYVDDDETREPGDTFTLLVDRNDPSSNDLPSDHGWAQLIGGGIGFVITVFIGVAAILQIRSRPRT